MKILYITPDCSNSGGIARVLSLKLNYFVKPLGYTVDVISVKKKNSPLFYSFDTDITWHYIEETKVNLSFSILYFKFINQTIAQTKPDVVVVCDAVLGAFIPYFIKTTAPLIFETHVSISLKQVFKQTLTSKIRFAMVHNLKKIAFKKFSKIVFETNTGRKEWELNNGVVIPNPLPFTATHLATLEQQKVIAVSRHSYEKGIDRLLTIWEKVVAKHPTWTLELYGQWEDDLKYQKVATALDLDQNITFLPPTPTIQLAYQEASIMLLTSRSEAFGMVLIEAMQCGLPCVSYDCPCGPKEIIVDGSNGFLIENDNEEQFVSKVSLLIEEHTLRQKLGQQAKDSSVQYEIDTVMKQWIQLFESELKG